MGYNNIYYIRLKLSHCYICTIHIAIFIIAANISLTVFEYFLCTVFLNNDVFNITTPTLLFRKVLVSTPSTFIKSILECTMYHIVKNILVAKL